MLIPNRNTNAVGGATFIKNNLSDIGQHREDNILTEFLSGNVPNFIRNFVSIDIESNNDKITYLVMPDVLSIGSDDDFVRMPMNPITARKICDQYNCILPTKKMCDQIWKAATIKLEPQPKGAPYDNSMLESQTYLDHNNKIEKQLMGKDKSQLVSGHKKDVIYAPSLVKDKSHVCIYGWFHLTGVAIQGPMPNCTFHEVTYKDYSHGIRLIAQDVIVNGQPKNIYDVLNDPKLCHLLIEETAYDASNFYK
jgi:hypothetical protein